MKRNIVTTSFKALSIIGFSVITLYSCTKKNDILQVYETKTESEKEKDEVSIEAKSSIKAKKISSNVKFENGMLVFTDLEEFENTMSELINTEESYLTQWEAKFSGYSSMRTTYNMFTNLNEDNIPNKFKHLESIYYRPDGDQPGVCQCEMPVGDMYFATIINPEGYFQIGEKIIKIEFEKVKIINDGEHTKKEMLSQINESRPDLNIEVHNAERIGNTCYTYYTSTKRVKGRMDIENWVVYSSAFFKVKYQEKNGTCWAKKTAQYLRAQGSWQEIWAGNIYQDLVSYKSYDSGLKYNKDVFQKNIASFVNVGNISHLGTSSGTLTVKVNNSVKSCTDNL